MFKLSFLINICGGFPWSGPSWERNTEPDQGPETKIQNPAGGVVIIYLPNLTQIRFRVFLKLGTSYQGLIWATTKCLHRYCKEEYTKLRLRAQNTMCRSKKSAFFSSRNLSDDLDNHFFVLSHIKFSRRTRKLLVSIDCKMKEQMANIWKHKKA